MNQINNPGSLARSHSSIVGDFFDMQCRTAISLTPCAILDRLSSLFPVKKFKPILRREQDCRNEDGTRVGTCSTFVDVVGDGRGISLVCGVCDLWCVTVARQTISFKNGWW